MVVVGKTLHTHARPSVDTKYDRAKVPPYNGNDLPPASGSLKTLPFPPLLNEVQNKGTQGVHKRGTAQNFLHQFALSGTPVVQSYWAWKVSLSKCPFWASNFTCTGESFRSFPSQPHEDDTCSVAPYTAIQGQTCVVFLKSLLEPPCRQWNSFSFARRGPAEK